MKRENFYILLELPFDPPANDPAQIKAAIHAKHQQWTAQLDDKELRGVALQSLELLPIMEEVMGDDTQRAAEAAEAMELREEAFTRFTAERQVLEGKGYLLPKELRGLITKYFPYGIHRDDIHKELTVPVTDTPPKAGETTSQIALPQEQMRNIRNNLRILDTENLFTFLEETADTPREPLLSAAERKKEESFDTAERSAKVFAAHILAETALTLFADDTLREQYQLALTVSQYPELNDLIDDEFQRAEFISSESLVRLVNFGVSTYDAKVLEVEDYIRRYCSAYGIAVDIMHQHIQCPHCGDMNSGDATVCESCAAPLVGSCPECGAPFDNGENVCANCGFLLGNMGKALEFLSTAEDAIVEGQWSNAQRALEHAANHWPGHPKLELLAERLRELELRNMDFMQTIEDYLAEKRYYAAQELLEEAQQRQIRIPSTTTRHIQDTLADFESGIEAIKEKGGASYDTLHDMLSHVADSMDLERMLSQYPPAPPSRITVRQVGESVEAGWNASESSGVIRYLLVRKEGSVPITAYDGDVLYQGTHHSFTDENVPALKKFYYSVFVKRGHSYSDIGAVAPVPVQIIPELADLRILPADGGAQMTWHTTPELHSVNLWRKLGGEAPTRPEDGMALDNDRLDGFTDMNLRNGVDYWYYITATYNVEDQLITSKGVSKKVTPQALVSPIDNLMVTPASDGEDSYIASWSDGEDHEIMLMLSLRQPSYYTGEVVRTTDLLYTNHRLTLEAATPNSARFSYSFSGGIYVFPASIQGKVAVVGAVQYVTNVPPVENPKVTTLGEDFYITADWPEGPVGEIAVAWKRGDYPTSLDEEGITKVTCSRRQYELDHGIHLTGLDQGTYYFTLFSAFETPEGKIIYSRGTRFLVDTTPHQEIRYHVKHSKPFFSSQYTTVITVRSDQEFIIPRAVLIGKEGSMPLRITDGTPYFELERKEPVHGAVTFEYKTEKLPEDLYLRWFYYDNQQYKNYRPLPERTVRLSKK